MMRVQLDLRCEQHPDLDDCPDSLVARLRDGRFGLRIHDGGSSVTVIEFCPWCCVPLS